MKKHFLKKKFLCKKKIFFEKKFFLKKNFFEKKNFFFFNFFYFSWYNLTIPIKVSKVSNRFKFKIMSFTYQYYMSMGWIISMTQASSTMICFATRETLVHNILTVITLFTNYKLTTSYSIPLYCKYNKIVFAKRVTLFMHRKNPFTYIRRCFP